MGIRIFTEIASTFPIRRYCLDESLLQTSFGGDLVVGSPGPPTRCCLLHSRSPPLRHLALTSLSYERGEDKARMVSMRSDKLSILGSCDNVSCHRSPVLFAPRSLRQQAASLNPAPPITGKPVRGKKLVAGYCFLSTASAGRVLALATPRLVNTTMTLAVVETRQPA